MEDGKLVQRQFGKVPTTITRELKDDDTLITVSYLQLSKRRQSYHY